MKLIEPEDTLVNAFAEYLHTHARGQAHAVTARSLSQALRLGRHGDRSLRALAHKANELGLLVCADNNGYFEPANPQEVDEMVGRLRSQAAEMYERARRIESLATQHFYSHQMPLSLAQ